MSGKRSSLVCEKAAVERSRRVTNVRAILVNKEKSS
jgi:hypothetical protein